MRLYALLAVHAGIPPHHARHLSLEQIEAIITVLEERED